MPTWLWVVIVVVAAIVVLAIVWSALRTRRTRSLKERFGPEYDRVAADAPTRRDAESELRDRADRREELDIRPLDPADAERYRAQWTDVQARFVDDPPGAVQEADTLIQSVMRDRGYPVEEFDRRSADLSVDHPHVVENYRAAHGIAVAHARGDAGTEELRTAVRHYRALFDELVETHDREEATR
jgi:hypothetical protein